MKDKLGPILIVIVLIIAVIATTASWLIWKLDENNRIGVNFEINGNNTSCITYSLNQKGNKFLIPVSNKEKGYITSIDITQNCEGELYADFKLKINKLPKELKDKAFKYIFVEGTRVISEEDFEEKKQGEILTIASDEPIQAESKNYKLYILIYDDNIKNKHYEFDLIADISYKKE